MRRADRFFWTTSDLRLSRIDVRRHRSSYADSRASGWYKRFADLRVAVPDDIAHGSSVEAYLMSNWSARIRSFAVGDEVSAVSHALRPHFTAASHDRRSTRAPAIVERPRTPSRKARSYSRSEVCFPDSTTRSPIELQRANEHVMRRVVPLLDPLDPTRHLLVSQLTMGGRRRPLNTRMRAIWGAPFRVSPRHRMGGSARSCGGAAFRLHASGQAGHTSRSTRRGLRFCFV